MRNFRFFLPLVALGLMAAANKPPITIRFHTETSAKYGSEFAMSARLPDSQRTVCLSKVATISESDVAAIFPFPADDGTMGCAFKLDLHGRIGLDTLSQQNHGSTLVGFVNSRLVTAMLIDRHVTDGVITIARGLKPEEIDAMRKRFPTLGESKKKKGHKQSPKDDPDPTLMLQNPEPIPATSPIPSNTSAPRGD